MRPLRWAARCTLAVASPAHPLVAPHRRALDRRRSRQAAAASTAASSIAMRRALRQKRQHRVGGVPQQRDWPIAPVSQRRQVVQRPFQPAFRQRQEVAHRLSPVPGEKCAEQFVAVALRAPALLRPSVVHDGDDIDQLAALHRVVDEMGVLAEPELDLVAQNSGSRPSAGNSARQAVRCGNPG